MSFENVVQTIENEFGTNWTSSTYPIRVDNVQKLVGTTKRKVNNLEQFVHLSVLPSVSRQAEIASNPYKRLEGFVQITWFGKSGTGTRNGYAALDTAKNIYELKTVNGVTFRAGNVVNIGELDGFYQLVLSIPYFTYVKT